MQQPNVGIDAFDHLPVQLEDEAQNAMRCRVLRAEIDVEVADVVFGHWDATLGSWQSAIGNRIMTAPPYP
jgi:hypothetical protein